MKTRETIIRRWFDMWLQKKDLGIAEMFSDNATYIESWGPEYHGSAKIKLWFDEWNTRGTVLQWDIKQFFHKANQTMVEWYFKNQMNDGKVEAFDGICNGVQREHNKKLNNGLPILHKVPPKRDYGRYFCILAEKGGTSHGGLTEKLSPFFYAQKQEVNAYGR